MISQLNKLYLFPAVLIIPSSHTHLNVLCVRSSPQATKNAQLSLPKSAVTHLPVRVSRVAQRGARAALFGYLHNRGFTFADADHISKHSPRFLQGLISNARISSKDDVFTALSNFLRYNPINEFEPFLESLGLSPSECASLLPRDLMFLRDDKLLLYNYHALCNFGVPRSKIGRMYLEANEIFKYEIGVLDKKLGAYEQLGLSKLTVIRLVTCSPQLLVGGVNNAVKELVRKLREMGFENDWIGGYLSSNNVYNWNRMLDTIRFLSDVGCNDTQIWVLFRTNPALLLEGSGRRVYVLVGVLVKLGFDMNGVHELFLKNPKILLPMFAKNLWKAVHFLVQIRMKWDKIAKIVSSHTNLVISHTLKGPNIVLKKFGGDRNALCQIIENDPLKLFTLASKSHIPGMNEASKKPIKYLEKTEFLKRIGFVENSDEMAEALRKFQGRGDQLQERFDCLVQAGLDFDDVVKMVKYCPNILYQKKDLLEKKIDCLKNCYGFTLSSIVGFPPYLSYNAERINLRFAMYEWLREEGAIQPTFSLSTVISYPDARFSKIFVDKHPEGPAKWEQLKNSLWENFKNSLKQVQMS